MSRKKLIPLAVSIIFQLALALPGQATVETNTVLSFKSSGSPVDTAASSDGHWFFVLTSQGKVEIYDTDGALKETITIDEPADSITSSPTGDALFLSNKATGAITKMEVNFIQNIDIAGAPFKGPEKAPVVIIVFSDFQCPYCSRVTPLLDEVRKQYPNEVKVVHKQFPLQSHKFAMQAAIATLAAHRQGKFWEMHDKIFENQASLNDAKVIELAKAIGLNMDKFTKDSKDPQLRKQVQTDLQSGIKAEVRGTPTLFINGRRVNARNLEGLKAMVDAELNKVKKGK